MRFAETFIDHPYKSVHPEDARFITGLFEELDEHNHVEVLRFIWDDVPPRAVFARRTALLEQSHIFVAVMTDMSVPLIALLGLAQQLGRPTVIAMPNNLIASRLDLQVRAFTQMTPPGWDVRLINYLTGHFKDAASRIADEISVIIESAPAQFGAHRRQAMR